MPVFHSPEYVLREARRLIESDRRSEIRLNANGGNSILLLCEPMKEASYIQYFIETLPNSEYEIIDIQQCLISFVGKHKADFDALYDALQSSTHQIFKVSEGEQSEDLFKIIISAITAAISEHKVPVLINTGALYGTGIHNIHIIEDEAVMRAKLPLLILYPATIEADRIMFLGVQPATKYRCMILY